jgi:hypothetical protein
MPSHKIEDSQKGSTKKLTPPPVKGEPVTPNVIYNIRPIEYRIEWRDRRWDTIPLSRQEITAILIGLFVLVFVWFVLGVI